MHDERHVIAIDGRALGARLDDALDLDVLRVARGADFDVDPERTVAIVARDMEMLERIRAAGFDGALILLTERRGAPRLRARRAGIAIFTASDPVRDVARALRCVLSKNPAPRLECASCHTTMNLAPRAESAVVFFCEDCRTVAAADPADPRVDIGGPGPG